MTDLPPSMAPTSLLILSFKFKEDKYLPCSPLSFTYLVASYASLILSSQHQYSPSSYLKKKVSENQYKSQLLYEVFPIHSSTNSSLLFSGFLKHLLDRNTIKCFICVCLVSTVNSLRVETVLTFFDTCYQHCRYVWWIINRTFEDKARNALKVLSLCSEILLH